MMFRFIVRYLGSLKHVPLLAWLVDALMALSNYAFNRDVIRGIDMVETKVSQWSGVSVSLHRFGGIEFNYRGRELGHIHSNGILDLLVDRKTKHRLLKSGIASEHHAFPRSGWISCHIASQEDVVKAISLLRFSYSVAQKKTGGKTPREA